MKERVIYNTYYGCFDDFRGAVLGFFIGCYHIIGQELRGRVRDKFRPVQAPISNF
jgi:hypothetical protein